MTRRSVSVIFISVLLASCSWFSGEGMANLQKHRQTWDTLGTNDYQFTLDYRCFCAKGPVPARVIVRADTLHAVLDPETKDTLRAPGSNRPAWMANPKQYPTIDQLFEIVKGELSKSFFRRPDSIEVKYNEEYGYPEQIYIDEQTNTFDDELTVIVNNYN